MFFFVKYPPKQRLLPRRGHVVHFHDRQMMKVGHPKRTFTLVPGSMASMIAQPTLPIWPGNDAYDFPMYWNNQYGDCMEEMAIHADQTMTANNGTESSFDKKAVLSQYMQASGGDNGLDEQTLLNQCWKPGLAGVAAASYCDALDIDPTNAQLMQMAQWLFMFNCFMLDVPDAWVNNFDTGVVWDAGKGIVADQNNGHGNLFNGVRANGNYVIRQWGTWNEITPAGVKICDASAFIVFSLRMFNAKGIAPNGLNYDQLAQVWIQGGGNAANIPANPFGPTPVPVPVNPPPAPAPDPTPSPTPAPAPNPLIAEAQQMLTEIIDGAFHMAEDSAKAAGDTIGVAMLSAIDAGIDAGIPLVFNDLEGFLNTWMHKVASRDSVMALAAPSAVARLKDAFNSCPYCTMLKHGVPLVHVSELRKHALPPGTLQNIMQFINQLLQTGIQVAPQLIPLILQIIQAVKGAGG